MVVSYLEKWRDLIQKETGRSAWLNHQFLNLACQKDPLSAEELRKIDVYWNASLLELSAQELIATAKKMVAGGKGLLAMDESESAPQGQ